MYHWTGQKIGIHAFYCMLGISLLQQVRRQAVAIWVQIVWPRCYPNKPLHSSAWRRSSASIRLVAPNAGNIELAK